MTITIPEIDMFEVISFISIASYFTVTLISWLLICVAISIGGTTFTKFVDKVKWVFCIALVISPFGIFKCFQNLHPLIAVGMFLCSFMGCLIISFPRS